MIKNIMVGAFIFSCASYAMDDLESGVPNKPQQCYTQRKAIQYGPSLRGPKYGAKIEPTSTSSYCVVFEPEPPVGGLPMFIGSVVPEAPVRKVHKVESVIPGKNITLWENYQDSYDVIYRRQDGVIVAMNLETGEELYAMRLERTEGNEKEELLQSEQGTLLVTNRDGTTTQISHKKFKNMAFTCDDQDDIEPAACHGCAGADKSDDNE